MLEIIGEKQLYQWDTGRNAQVTVDCNEVHFSNLKFGKAYVVDVKDGVVRIPDEVLHSGEVIYCWAFVRFTDGGQTKCERVLPVINRAKPSDYVYTPSEVASIKAVQKQIEAEQQERAKQDEAVLNLCVQAIQNVQEQMVGVVQNEQNERVKKDKDLQSQIDEIQTSQRVVNQSFTQQIENVRSFATNESIMREENDKNLQSQIDATNTFAQQIQQLVVNVHADLQTQINAINATIANFTDVSEVGA